jgi:succinate dehydrogenase / fumarate reductase membrane anchor subunit
VSAVVIGLYALCVIGFFAVTPDLDHAALVAYFGSMAMQFFSTLAVLATAAHAWIGMWTIGTDYVRPHYFGNHATTFRAIYQSGTVLVIFIYVAWALRLFWGLSA